MFTRIICLRGLPAISTHAYMKCHVLPTRKILVSFSFCKGETFGPRLLVTNTTLGISVLKDWNSKNNFHKFTTESSSLL